MELSERINILKQAAELAQKGGALSLDEASVTKQAMDNLTNNTNVKLSLNVLCKIAILAQKKGVFTLKDAHFVYLATDGVESLPDDISL